MLIQRNSVELNLITDPIIGSDASKDTRTIQIAFPIPYKQPPYILLSLEKIDCGAFIEQSFFKHQEKPLLHTVTRYDISAQDISGTGFTLKISTWNSNTIYGFRASWIAFGEKAIDSQERAERLKDNFLDYLLKEMKKYDEGAR